MPEGQQEARVSLKFPEGNRSGLDRPMIGGESHLQDEDTGVEKRRVTHARFFSPLKQLYKINLNFIHGRGGKIDEFQKLETN